MNSAVVSIGSNINPEENIPKALTAVAKAHTVLKVSSLVRTKPIGFTNQPDFTNGSMLVTTVLQKDQFDRYLKDLELQLGRIKGTNKYGPRTIDLDIIVWNGKIIDNDFYERDFLRNSILEIFPSMKFSKNILEEHKRQS
jgi:2-amino-4-hydroxy-6-hydroxymethyldihydropteridine diphosphokinase